MIAAQGKIPWHISADLRHFKKLTTGHPVIMGRKTYDALPQPLPARQNIIVSRNSNFFAPGQTIAHSLEQAIKIAEPSQELFIIGGEEIFNKALVLANHIYLTEIQHTFQGDRFFPNLAETDWKETKKESYKANQLSPYDLYFLEYKKTNFHSKETTTRHTRATSKSLSDFTGSKGWGSNPAIDSTVLGCRYSLIVQPQIYISAC